MQRRDLLKGLYEKLPNQSRVHTSKRVNKIDHSNSGVVVHCVDGSQYSGDIVVGADGIHSVVTPAMLQHIELSKPGTTEKDKNCLSAEYNCIFGLGDPVQGVVREGDSHRSYAKGHSALSFVGRGGKLYWFLFSKMDKRYYGKHIPKFSKIQMEEAAKAFYDIHMTDTITYKDVWATRTFANMACIEEATHEHWTSGRFVCLGDSVHKVRKGTYGRKVS
jgi:2-polyprenyl-6-methoxyphenol hydroxylase-like FAD-dependent oxidoreductase